MRDQNIETITFTDINGKQCAIKDIRPIEEYTTAFTLKTEKAMYIDEIASRDAVYGKNGEELSYAIIEANLPELTEAGFDMTKIKTLKIPILEA